MARKILQVAQPSVRITTTWSPARLRALLNTADGGNFRALADLCDQLLADDRIGACFETRIGGLLGLPITFEPSGDGRKRNRAVKALEADEDWWTLFPEDELTQLLTWGRLAGFSWAQLVYQDENGKPLVNEAGRLTPRAEFWHPQHFRYDQVQRKWFVRRRDASGNANSAEEEAVPGDGQWILYTPNGRFRPWAHGLWRGLSRWWLLKYYAIGDAGVASETSVRQVVTREANFGDEEANQLASDLADAGREGAIVLPAGFDLKLLESKNTIAQNQGYLIETSNTAIAVSVLGQNLTTEAKAGGLGTGNGKVHERVEQQRIKSDAETGSTTLREQALKWWAEYNFGSRDLAPWPTWKTDPPEDSKAKADTWKAAAETVSAFKTAGFEVDPKQIEEEFGIKLTKAEPPPAPVVAPPPPPSPAEEPDAEEEPEPEEEAKALASRFQPRNAAGFVDGQTYADRLVAKGSERGVESLAGFVDGLLQTVNDADDLGALREQILTYYRDAAEPTELAERVSNLATLAQLGGIAAVRQDVPELDE